MNSIPILLKPIHHLCSHSLFIIICNELLPILQFFHVNCQKKFIITTSNNLQIALMSHQRFDNNPFQTIPHYSWLINLFGNMKRYLMITISGYLCKKHQRKKTSMKTLSLSRQCMDNTSSQSIFFCQHQPVPKINLMYHMKLATISSQHNHNQKRIQYQ